MPTSPPSRGSNGARPAARSFGNGGGRGPSGPPKTNIVPYVAAGAVLLLVVALVVSMAGGKKPTQQPKTAAPVAQPEPTVPQAPPKAGEKPYPVITQAKLQEGRDLLRSFDADAEAMKRLYDESLRLKDADRGAWQAKLQEAQALGHKIKDAWNEFIATLPSSNDYDEELVARHYFARESGPVFKKVSTVDAAMKSDKTD